MKVSIVVAYNTQYELTLEFLDKMQETTKDEKFKVECVLVHGWVKGEESHVEHPFVTRYVSLENIGFCKTLNAGLTAVPPDSDYIFFVGNDSFPRENGWLGKLVKTAEKTKSTIICPRDQLPITARNHLYIDSNEDHCFCNMYPSVAWLIPYKVFDEIGFLEEKLTGAGYYADDDYCRRIRNEYGDGTIVLDKNVTLDHRTSSEGKALGVTGHMAICQQIYNKKWDI